MRGSATSLGTTFSHFKERLGVAAGIVAGLAFAPPAIAQTKPTTPIIVKDTTSS